MRVDSAQGYSYIYLTIQGTGFTETAERQRSAHVLIESGVLSTNGKKNDLIIEASGSSTVLVWDTSTAVTLLGLNLEASGSASIQLNVASVSTSKDVVLEAQGSAIISLLASSLEVAGDMMVETQNSGTICTTAKQVMVTGDYSGEAASGTSMPNASDKHGATGTLACDKVGVPAREPSSVSKSGAASSSKSGARAATADTSGNVNKSTSVSKDSSKNTIRGGNTTMKGGHNSFNDDNETDQDESDVTEDENDSA